MSKAGTPFTDRFTVRINGHTFKVATPDEVRAATAGRAWTERRKSAQLSSGERFSIAFRDFSTGAGFSHDGPAGSYCYARGWDASAPGQVVTWGPIAEGDSFISTDTRGWQFRVGQYLYAARGRYVCKYLIRQGISAVNWPIIERHDLAAGTVAGNVIAGRPELFAGKAYVPVRTGVTGALTRFHELDTVATFDAEIETVVVAGTPTAGSYILTYDGKATANIAFNADGPTVQAALRLVPGLEQVTVSTAGTIPNFTHTVTMTGVGAPLGASSPSALVRTDNTTGGTHSVTVTVTHEGTSDKWDLAPASLFAKHFRRYGTKLQRGQGAGAPPIDANRIYGVEADPMTLGDWAPAVTTGYEFGDNAHETNDMADFGSVLVVGKSDGIYSLDPSFQSQALLPDFVGFADDWNCIGMETGLGMLLVPMIGGLVAFDGSTYDVIGPDQEKRLNSRIDHGVGRFSSLAVAGDRVYYVANDGYRTEGILGSFSLPQGQPRDIIWHQHEIESGRYENVILLPALGEPAAPKYPSTWTGSTGAGTLAWTAASNAGTEDDTGATASGTGSTKDLIGLSTQPNVPAEATIVGVEAAVRARAYGSVAPNATQHGFLNSNDASYANAQAGTGALSASTATTPECGQNFTAGTYQILEGFIDFDTSGIPDAATLISATLRLTPFALLGTSNSPILQARLTDFGATLTTSDWANTSNNLTGKPLLATLAHSAMALGSPVDLVSESAFVSNINLTGYTRITLVSNNMVAGTPPVGDERVAFYDSTATAANRPTLTVLYKDVLDNVVKLVIAGSAAGTSKASTTSWTSAYETRIYGGATDLWGTGGITPAQANASDHGIVVSLVSTTAAVFDVDSIALTYYYTVPGQSDVATLMSVLVTDRETGVTSPKIWQLPRNGMTVANDPNLAIARDDAVFQTYRHSGPGRNLDKAYDVAQFYCEMSASNGTGPALNVMYSFDDSHWDYLLGGDDLPLEVGAELGTAGAGSVTGYFPRTSDAWAYENNGTVALQFVLAAKTGVEVDTSVLIRDVEIWGWYRPKRNGEFDITLMLGELTIEGGGIVLKGVQQQIRELEEVVGEATLPVAYHSPGNRDGYAVITAVELREGMFADGDRQWPVMICRVSGEWASAE